MQETGIVGLGSFSYKFKSGREGDSKGMAFIAMAKSTTLFLSLKAEQMGEITWQFSNI